MNTKKITKQVVGIDIGKDSFYACYKLKHTDGTVTTKGTRSFDNKPKGIAEFYLWCKKRDKTPEAELVYVMEATGVYYEDLAYFLHSKEQIVSIQLAQKVKYFAKGCNLKTKTDKVDSKMIAEFGIEKNLKGTDLWIPLSEDFKIMRDLTREHSSLKANLTAIKSQIHALNHSHKVYATVTELKKKQIDFCDEQIILIEKELRNLVKADKELFSKINKIATVKGLSFMTIIKVLTETNGFILFKSIRQLVSYAGLDVIEKESGKFTGKTKISKKGNARIRTALYMPALTAVQYNRTLKVFYERVNEGRSQKKQGVIAVMRKLLILIYTLWKKDDVYNENYQRLNLE